MSKIKLMFLALFAGIACIAGSAGAQQLNIPEVKGWQLTSITASSGDNPITSGWGLVVGYTKEKKIFELTFQEQQAQLFLGRKYGAGSTSGHIGATVAHFQGAVWIGPRFVSSTKLADGVSFNTIAWPGLFLSRPSSFDTKRVPSPMIGKYGGVNLALGPIGLDYGIQKFLTNPWNKLPGTSYSFNLTKELGITSSATYNTNDKKLMFLVSGTLSIGRPSSNESVAGSR